MSRSIQLDLRHLATRDGMRNVMNGLALIALIVFGVVESAGELLRSGVFDQDALGDFFINAHHARGTLSRASYSETFYYPVPFALLFNAVWWVGLEVAAPLWLAAVAGSLLLSVWLALDLCGLNDHRWRWVVGLIAVAAVLPFAQRDLRSANTNSIALALVLGSLACGARGRGAAAGALLATGAAAKLYCVVLLPYLVWRREWRWLAWSLGCGGILFAVVPAVALGPELAWKLTLQWLDSVLAPHDPWTTPDFYKSFTRSMLLWLAEPSAIETASVRPVRIAVALLLATWTGAVVFQLVRSAAWPLARARDRLYADATVLLLLPLPFSPTFQAHHAVVALLPALLLAGAVFDPARTRRGARHRLAALAALLAPTLLMHWAPV